MPNVTDAQGRVIGYRVMDPADMLDLLEAAGPASSNAGFIRYAAVICSVTDIDGVPVPTPTSRADIRASGKKLGNDGLVALSMVMFGGDDAPAQTTEEAAKN